MRAGGGPVRIRCAMIGPAALPADSRRERCQSDRLIAEGRVTRPLRRRLPKPIALAGDPYALSRALDEMRGEC